MIIELDARKPYDFATSVRDHGWIALLPFHWLDEQKAVQRVERLSSGKVVLLQLTSKDVDKAERIFVDVQAEQKPTKAEQQEIRDKVGWMLRLDEDMSDFYHRCESDPELLVKLASGRGRLLRSATLFEDVVKTICTTNTMWSQTKGMVTRIVDCLGDVYPLAPELHAFPTPEQVAAADDVWFQTEIRLGYRNAFVLKLAREIAEGKRDLEALKTSDLPAKELKKELKQITGVGDYAAHTLLMLLSRYDEVAVDTEFRSFVSKKYGQMTDKEMAALYDRWDRWKYLAYWFEAW
jgi:3-methyladenine DNA glycosylase/8-oxoguanine DNA glycosylase